MKKIYDDPISDVIGQNIPDNVSDLKGSAFDVFSFVKRNTAILGLAKSFEFSEVAATTKGLKTVRIQLDKLEWSATPIPNKNNFTYPYGKTSRRNLFNPITYG